MKAAVDRKGQSPQEPAKSPDPQKDGAEATERRSAPEVQGWAGVRQLHPAELASRLANGDCVTMLDVREPWEWETARLEGARHIPLGEFARSAEMLDRDDEIVIYCHHGVRSLSAARYLAERGFTRLWNLTGGIERYSLEVDSTIPQY